MPATMNKMSDHPKKGSILKSAYDSDTFDADGTIHVDGMVGSATISPCGRDVALASPEGLAIIDLDSPYSPPRRLSSHGSPWLVVDVQWSPFAARDYWVASTANHRCLVWNLNFREDSTTGAIEHSLHGHSRAITDINFSAHHPDILATCAVDGYVHCWDLRRPRQPVLTFCDWFAGATQVKYNRQDPNILASSHDRWLHIWDERKPSVPLKSISAHTSKIYGLDWNRTKSTSVVTCSLDKSIKFWDYNTPDEPERIIRTDFPVWRARHTPFGWGLLAMPQNDPGNLYLYDIRRHEGEPVDGNIDPLAVFPGHGNHKVKEFLWRGRGSVSEDGIDNREFQLVSWGEDNELRLHKADPDILESVGHVKGGQARNIILTRKGAAYKTYRAVDDHPNREKRSPTMSDPRPGSGGGGQYRRSALTLGMQTAPLHVVRSNGGSTWKGPSMKVKPAIGKVTDRSLDQLGWMKGITMSKKRLPHLGTPQRKDSKDSTMFGPSFHDNNWGEPETLQEEILRVNQQLPNVQWDNLDMDSLTLKASLQGPWGADGDTIYIKVKVDIPTNYPKSRAPRFIVEKTALMSDQTYRKIDQEVNQLAGQFSRRRQNCLEVAFSYLLGEVDLSSSDALFKNVKDLDDDLGGLIDESSSEEEDNGIPTGGSATMSQELTASVELDPTLVPSDRTIIPPVPRTCGARFSNDGRLVCFFPTKEEKAKALLFTPTDTYKERPKGEPTFAGFGRLQQDSTPPRHRYANDETSVADDQSDSGSEQSSSSSDSETTYMHKINTWYLPGRRFRKTFSGSYSMHSSGGGTGIGTGTGTGTSRRRPGKPKSIISIHNVAGDLPSKRELAQEYLIFGDGVEVCEHNARIAEKYHRPDLVDVWRYASLLLRKDIPLELLGRDKQRDTVLVIAKDAVTRFDQSSGQHHDAGDPPLTGRVKWGHHPLAKDMIKDLFGHYEKIADVQMLAMLSCVFSESSTQDSVAYAESHLTQPETPLPMKAPSFSLDYFPTDASLWHTAPSNQRLNADSGVSTPRILQTPVQVIGSYGSEEGAWPGDPGSNSYSCGDTPPTRTPKEASSEGDTTQSLSTSPENRLLRRANTALTSSLASFPRALASVASTSPPGRKRASPGETLQVLSNLAPTNITWGGSSILGPTSEPSATARTSYSDDEVRKEEALPLVCYGISTKIEDQSIFDEDGWLAVPFLEPSHAETYANYRYAYAEMLQMWGQPLARLEILKFNVLKDGSSEPSPTTYGHAVPDGRHNSYHNIDTLGHTSQSHHSNGSPIVLGRKEQLQSLVASDRGIDVIGICRTHETHLTPDRSTRAGAAVGGAVGTCDRCKRTQKQLTCVFCLGPIDALYIPCLSCGCAIHEACLTQWHAAGETECPAGDECNCVEDASSGQVETWAALIGAMRQGKGRRVSEERDDKHVHEKRGSFDKNDWETVSSESTIPVSDGQGKPLEYLAPMSAARISLGNRLRKSAGGWGSNASLRKKSGSGSSSLAPH
ncbi:hypothetical protein F4778DRAFT_774781 [Xylariomycetidae sp. FL2044]|nr:hypothetical protein F4778DRAFT_774781 [Xylariomycetidae sp. FL2044]